MEKYIYIIAFICVLVSGVLIGRGSTKGTIDSITDNLQRSESRVSELESTISDSRNTIAELENQLTIERDRIKQQTEFIDKITKGFADSRESVNRIESGADRGSEIIEELFKEINNQ